MADPFLFSTALLETTGQFWFFSIDLIGTMAFALSGFILAYREKMTLFGALVLSSFPAIGGGILRDLIVNRHPIAVLASPVYLLAIFGVVLMGFLLVNFFTLFHEKYPLKPLVDCSPPFFLILLEICDALGLAAFIVIGVGVAFLKACQPLWLWGPLLAILTSCGGGIIRDLFCSRHSHSLLKQCFYGEIAFFWGLMLALFLETQTKPPEAKNIFTGVGVVMLGAFITRLLVFFTKTPGLPLRLK